MPGKVILLDASVFSFKAAFTYELALKYHKGDDYVLSSDYTYLNMIISCLKKINVDENTTVILCIDDKSWRKEFYSPYKAQRKEAREKHKLLNWDEHFQKVNRINETLDYATPFHVLRIPRCEADDIIAVACRVFKNDEIIIASIDSDLQQLCQYPNVKFFSGNFKMTGGKGGYIAVENPLGILDKKCRLGDKSDNILVDKNEDEEDANLRKSIVTLLELPDFIENHITEVLQNLPIKNEIKWEQLPFQKSLAKRFKDIFDPQFKIEYDYCIKLQEKRIIRKKKKAKLKKENKSEDKRTN